MMTMMMMMMMMMIVVHCTTGWVQQYSKSALEAFQFKQKMEQTMHSQQTSTSPAPSTSASSAAETEASTDPPSALLSKRAKLFNFMSASGAQSQTLKTAPSVDDIKPQYALFSSTSVVCGHSLEVFLDPRFNSLLPLARAIFTPPVSSAASERVFSRAGLVMRPTRSRLSKANLSKLVFLNCNQSLDA